MSILRLEPIVRRGCTIMSTLLTLLVFSTAITLAQVNVLTERYDQSRLGANLTETQLTTSNVNVNSFGKLWSYSVSGSVYAQSLYVRNVAIAGNGTHNVLYIATMNDMVYAFDADSNSNVPLLSLDLTQEVAGSTPVPVTDIVGPGLNIVGNIGITGTPHIDPVTNTMYLVARTKEPGSNCGSVNGNYCQRLHALDITNFTEKFGGPVVIQGSVPGTGNGSQSGTLVFDPKIHNQRSSLALANGQIFIGWASHEDQNPYHGWVMSYNASTLKQTGIWSSTPDGAEGGVWMAGWAPTVDTSNNVYYIAGNGDWNGTRNFGESILKFGSSSGMPLLDWFTPDTWSSLNAGDVDLGSTGAMLIPGTDLLIGTGKSSEFYVMHTGNLGHEQTGNSQIVQSFSNHSGEIKGGPVYWNRSGGAGPWMYVWANSCDYLKAYHFNGSMFDTGVVSESLVPSACGASGGVLTLSANGSAAGSGILWSSMPLAEDGDHGVHAGILRAFNADDLTKELWNSHSNPGRDDSGNWPKFSPPIVVNGRVYLPSFPADGTSNSVVNVFGLLPAAAPDFSIAASPANQAVAPGGSVTYTVSTGAVNGFTGTVALSVSGLSSGATASFASPSINTPGSTALTVKTGTNTPVGSSSLTITGVAGSLVHATKVALQVSSGVASAYTISIDFVGRGTSMAASETAGVVAKSNWNDAVGSAGSGLALRDETGVISGATVSWTSSPVWSLGIADNAGNSRMMNGYLDTVGQNTSVNVSGLLASSAGYDIYVYADGDNGGATRTGTYQLSGSGIATTSFNLTDAASANFNGTFTKGTNATGNYVLFSSVYAPAFTLTAIPGQASDGTQRAPVNGIQVVPHVAPFDFTLSLSPASSSVIAGGSTTYQVTTTANNLSGSVALAATGLPNGATASFSPTSLTGAGTSTLTISTAKTTASATSNIAVTGTSGSLSHSVSATLKVSAPISRVAWTLQYVDSQETAGENGAATNAFDANLNSFWHTQWSGANPIPPHEIQINLGGSYSLTGLSYLPRQDGCTHGDINQYEFYVSADGVNWGSPVASGNFTYGTNFVYGCPSSTLVSARVVTFPAVTGRYVRLRALSEMGGNPWTSAADINLLQ